MELQTSRSGAGGKIVTNRRKVRIAASASPYVRPPQPSPLKSPNWFSGVVFPSARAIASGAGKILSAIFSDSDSTSSDEEEDIASEDDIDNDNLPGISCDQENTLNEKNVTSSEMMMQYKQEPRLSVWKSETKKTIEQLIMTETFSREEHDRLIKVIDSRVIDGSMDSGEKSSCAGPWNKLDENAGNFDKAVQEAKRWFQEKKARLSSGTELPQGSNLNSTMLEHVETGGGSPEDVVRSYMKTRPSWASSSERSFVSGSWDIQEELRRVRSRETEDTLSSPGKTYSSHFQVAQMRMGSARACEEVFAMGETMIEPQSAGLHRPSEALSSKPDISVSINNKVPGDVQADAEFSTSKLIHPSSPDHAEDPHSDLMENNTSNGNIINVEGVCVLLSEAHMEIPDITETSASGALVPYETETSTSGELVLYEEQSRDLSQPYAMVLYEERSLDITQPSAMVLYEERSLDIAQPSAIEKHITARKKRGRKAMKYYNTRSRGKRMDPLPSATIARQTWELENNIVTTSAGDSSATSDAIFFYDDAAQAKVQQEKPWANDPNYFKRVKVSALALLKMVVHARSGGTIEVMGLMQGKTEGDTIIVMDAFALPVEGTETRVNAQADAYEYMVEYSQTNQRAGRLENVVGWYHSHPGYGCWLSGIDVSTQMLNQQYQEPFLAVVIDPTRTVSAGKVEIGAFRTYPEGYKPADEQVSEYQTIPLNKIEDFGVHCKQYYALDITYFKSTLDSHLLDLLWNKYWVNTLSSSPLLGNADFVAGQISDLADKIEQAENQMAHSGFGSLLIAPQRKKEQESQLNKITRDCSKITVEQVHGLMSQVIKDILFNSVTKPSRSETDSDGVEAMTEP